MSGNSVVHSSPEERISSPEVADLVSGVLEGHVNYLLENNFTNIYQEDGQQFIHVKVLTLCDPDHEYEVESGLYREQQKTGYVDGVSIKRELGTDHISFAEVSVILPPSITAEQANGFYRGDGWHARFYFSTPENSTADTPQAMLDTWRVPLTEVSRAMKDLSDNYSEEKLAEYDRFYKRVFTEKDASGIPVEARDIRHVVLGYDQELDLDTYDLIKVVLGLFDQGVRDGVAWSRMINLSMAAEQTMYEDPTVLEQLKVFLVGIRNRRQEEKRQIGSPLNVLMTLSAEKKGKSPSKKLRGSEEERRIAEQIAQGAPLRAARAARRAAQQLVEQS